jgi:pimeloyl-ACP methyl ester carboxylesterase
LGESSRRRALLIFIHLLNTDIARKRPPWLALYRLMFSTQFGRNLLNIHLVKKYIVPSRIMLGLAFDDASMINDEFRQIFITPMLSQPHYFEGLGNYLRGFNYKEVYRFDDMRGVHKSISATVHMIWGEEDPTFPLKFGEQMARNIPSLKNFYKIPKTRLLPHEEQPGLVLEAVFKSLHPQPY